MLSCEVIEKAKEFISNIKTEEEHSKFIYQLYTDCNLSVSNIAKCYENSTPDIVANYLINIFNIKLRKCSKCNQWKSVLDYYNTRPRECKECRCKQEWDRKTPQPQYILDLRLEYDHGDFEESLVNMCKKQYCIEDISQVLKTKMRVITEFLTDNNLEYLIYRRCSWCSEVKNISEFHKKSTFKIHIVSHCAKCDYEEKSRNQVYKTYNIDYHREVLYQNISHKLSKNFSNAIYRNLAKQKNNIHWENFVDFTLDELKLHLESKFDDKMNWNNYGIYWQIDHIVPVEAFNFTSCKEEAFKKCWSLQNLQPLEKSLNAAKQHFISEKWNNVELAAQLLS